MTKTTIDFQDDEKTITPEKLQSEQKQELFEVIRHYMKYLAFGRLNGACQVPEEAHAAMENLIRVYEIHFEVKNDQ
jgi:hypothetical protein